MESKDPQSAAVSVSLDSPAQSMIPDRNQLDWDEYLSSLEALLSKRFISPTNRNYDRQRDLQTSKMVKTQLKSDDPEIFHDGQNSKYHLNVTKKFFEAFVSISEQNYNSTTKQKRQSSNDGDRNEENAEGGAEKFRPILRSATVDVIPVPYPIIEFDTHIYRYQLKKLRRYYEVSGMKKHQSGIDSLLRLLDDSFYLASIFDQPTTKSRKEKSRLIAESDIPEPKFNNVERSVNEVDANENKDEQQEKMTESLVESSNSTEFEKGNFTADEIEKLASDLENKNQNHTSPDMS